MSHTGINQKDDITQQLTSLESSNVSWQSTPFYVTRILAGEQADNVFCTYIRL